MIREERIAQLEAQIASHHPASDKRRTVRAHLLEMTVPHEATFTKDGAWVAPRPHVVPERRSDTEEDKVFWGRQYRAIRAEHGLTDHDVVILREVR